jgi:signal transduction histidine kinase
VEAEADPDLNSIEPAQRNSRAATDVWVVPAGGGDALRLTNCGDNLDPTWSPDGRSLFFRSAQPDEHGRLGGYDLRQSSVEAGAQPTCWNLTTPDLPSVEFLAAAPLSLVPPCLALVRRERSPCTYRERDWAFARLRGLDLGLGCMRDLLSDEELLAALQDPRNGVTPDQLQQWRRSHDLRAHVRDLAWSPDGQRLALVLSVARPYKDRPYCPTAPTDLWTYDVRSAELRRLTANDDTEEMHPQWSPNGPWLAFAAERSDTQPAQQEVWLVNTRSGDRRCLGPGATPQWRPLLVPPIAGAMADQLALLRNGDLWTLTLEPPRPPRTWPFWMKPLLGALGGALFMGLFLGFRVPRRVARLASRWLAPLLPRGTPQALHFGDLAAILDRLERNLHQLSPALEILPGFDDEGETDWATSVSRCLAMPSLWGALQRMLDDGQLLLAEEPAFRRALGLLSPDYRPRFTLAFDRFLQAIPVLRQHQQQLLHRAGSELSAGAERTRWAEAARQEINALRALVDPDPTERRHNGRRDYEDPGRLFRGAAEGPGDRGDGLLRLAEQSKAALWVGTVLFRLRRSLLPEAESRGLRLDLPQAPGQEGEDRGPRLSPLALVPCDPGTLETIVDNLVRNAFHAVNREAARGAVREGYGGQVTVQILEVGEMIHLTVADNGCGLSEEEVLALREGRRGPGLGLRHVRRLVRDYPAGAFELTSPGPGQGARATVSLRSL